jgi:hypothetical protein
MKDSITKSTLSRVMNFLSLNQLMDISTSLDEMKIKYSKGTEFIDHAYSSIYASYIPIILLITVHKYNNNGNE